MVYNMYMFSVVCKKIYFLRLSVKNANLILPRFMYRVNRDSESGIATTPKLVSMT